MTENITNNGFTQLAANIGPTDTVITVLSSANFPAPNFRIVIDSEICICTAVSGTSWTVTRGQEQDHGGSPATGHSQGATVAAVLTVAGLAAQVQQLMYPIYCGPIVGS